MVDDEHSAGNLVPGGHISGFGSDGYAAVIASVASAARRRRTLVGSSGDSGCCEVQDSLGSLPAGRREPEPVESARQPPSAWCSWKGRVGSPHRAVRQGWSARQGWSVRQGWSARKRRSARQGWVAAEGWAGRRWTCLAGAGAARRRGPTRRGRTARGSPAQAAGGSAGGHSRGRPGTDRSRSVHAEQGRGPAGG